MKTYIIPERNRLAGMMVTDMQPPLPRVLHRLGGSEIFGMAGEDLEKLPGVKKFVLQTITDIAVYREEIS